MNFSVQDILTALAIIFVGASLLTLAAGLVRNLKKKEDGEKK